MILNHHSWEPEVEVILSVTVSLLLCYAYTVDMVIQATACAHGTDTIRLVLEFFYILQNLI